MAKGKNGGSTSSITQISPHSRIGTQTASHLTSGVGSHDEFSLGIIRAILDGSMVPEIHDPGCLGPWVEVVTALQQALKQGGTLGARKALDALCKKDAVLAALVASNSSSPSQRSWSVKELLEADLPEISWVIEGFLSQGLTILAGRPKIGKSWLALQLALSISTGTSFLGRNAVQGRVLYLALEDSPRRLQVRLRKLGVRTDAVTFYTDWEPLLEGGLDQLRKELSLNKYDLVAIDTLSRVAGRNNQLDSTEMNLFCIPLQRLAIDTGTAILAVDHHGKPKQNGPSAIDDLLGSTAKAAVADAVWGLYLDRMTRCTILRGTGRDFSDQELNLKQDKDSMLWCLAGDDAEPTPDSVKAGILAAIQSLHDRGKLAIVTRIAAMLNKDVANVSRELGKLELEGKVKKLPKQGKEQPYELLQKEELPW